MPKPVKQIFVDLTAQPNVRKQKAKSSDAIVWIPESELETITVTFLDGKTPFRTDVLQAPCPGGCVGGVVTGSDDTYKYRISVNRLRTVSEVDTTAAADPEIIIDSGSGVPPEPRKRRGKSTQRKNSQRKAGRRKKTGKKKTGKKKAAKKR